MKRILFPTLLAASFPACAQSVDSAPDDNAERGEYAIGGYYTGGAVSCDKLEASYNAFAQINRQCVEGCGTDCTSWGTMSCETIGGCNDDTTPLWYCHGSGECDWRCTSDAQCPSTLYCVDGVCKSECLTYLDCAPGQTCQASKCVDPDPSDCPWGCDYDETCIDGICELTGS